MSDLDNYLTGQDSDDEPTEPKGTDLTHFLATLGEGAMRSGPAAIGMVGDAARGAYEMAKGGMQGAAPANIPVPGLGPVSQAVNEHIDANEPDEVKPRNDLERYVNSIGMGLGGALLGGPEAGIKAIAGGVTGGISGQAAYDATGSPEVGLVAGLVGGGAPFAIRGKSRIARGSAHPDYDALANRVIPALEGGGTYENPLTNSHSGAMGPMQVTPETARDPGYGIKPWDGKSQEDLARVGREKVAAMLHKYDGKIDETLAAYNWGEGNVDKAIAKHGDNWFYHAPAETQKYILDGKMRLGMDSGSTGGPVPPMHPDDMAAAMGEEPQRPAPPVDPQEGQMINASDAFNDKTVDNIHEGVSRIRDNVVDNEQPQSPAHLEHLRSQINDQLVNAEPGSLAEQKLLEIDNMLKEAIANSGGKPRLYTPDAAEPHFQEPRSIDPANENQPRDLETENALNTPENLAGAKATWEAAHEEYMSQFRQPDDYNSAMTRQKGGTGRKFTMSEKDFQAALDHADEATRKYWQDKADEIVAQRGGKEPPKEPPFGGGGHGGDEPPKGPVPEGDKYAGSINLNRMAISNAAKESIKTMAAPLNMDIEAFHETRTKANQLIDDKGVEGVLNQSEVKPEDLAHYATAVRAIHAAAQEHMLSLNEQFLDPARNGDVAHARWLHAREVLATAFDRNQNIAKGLGRGLGSLRIEVGGTEGNLGEKIADAMKTRQSDEEIAKMIQEHPEEAGKIARDSQKPSASDYIFTTWYAMLLSSLKTLSKNVLSNGFHGTWESGVVYPIAAAFGKLHGGEKVTFTEVGARFAGAMHGTLEGFKNAPEAYRQGAPSDFAERTQSYWKPQNKGIGRVVSAPMRVLSAQDQVFLDIGQNAEYFGLAHRQAAKEGLTPGTPEYAKQVQNYLENPTKKMEKSAVEYGKYIRFQDPMEFKGLEYATRATKKDPAMIKVMKGFLRMLVPFPRNADRMFFAAIRNSPLGVMEPKNMRDFAAGGAMRDVAAARVFAGTMLAGAVYTWAANGGITGANPADPSKKFMMNFGPVHVSYQGLADPFSTSIAAIATAVEDAKTGTEDLYNKIFKSSLDLTSVLVNSTWSTGASQFFAAADDNTGKTMQNWVGRMASSFTTPAIIREINQDYLDPIVRNTKEHPIGDNVKAGLPFLSNTLPARHDAFGDTIKRENPAYLDAINPARIQIDKHPGMSKDLAGIESATPLLSKAPKSITVDGEKHTLSAKGQEKYQKLSGKIFTELMEENRGQLQALPNDEKVKLVRETLSEARKQAREELWGS